MAILFSDDYNRSGALGGSWIERYTGGTAEWNCNGAEARVAYVYGGDLALYPVPAATTGTVKIRLTHLGSSNADAPRLVFRASGFLNYWYVVPNIGTWEYELHRVEAGIDTFVASTSGVTAQFGDRVWVVFDSTTIRLQINRVEVLVHNSSVLAGNTYFGLGLSGAGIEGTAPSSRWDDFEVNSTLHQPVGGPGIYLQDEFTDADNTSLINKLPEYSEGGTRWQLPFNGGVLVHTGKVRLNAAGTSPGGDLNGGVVIDVPGRSDAIKIQVTFVNAYGGSATQHLIFRYWDTNNYLYVKANASAYAICKKDAGSHSTLASVATARANGDRVEVRLNGRDIAVYRNGTLLVTASTSFNETRTGVGFGGNSNGASGTGDEFDDFYVVTNGSIGASSQTIAMAGVASGAAYGIAALTGTATYLRPASVESAAAFGTANLDQVGMDVLRPTGVVSMAQFGVPNIVFQDRTIEMVGVPSGAAFGVPKLVSNTVIAPLALVSGAAFGVANLQQSVRALLGLYAKVLAETQKSLGLKATVLSPGEQALGLYAQVGIAGTKLLGLYAQVSIGTRLGLYARVLAPVTQLLGLYAQVRPFDSGSLGISSGGSDFSRTFWPDDGRRQAKEETAWLRIAYMNYPLPHGAADVVMSMDGTYLPVNGASLDMDEPVRELVDETVAARSIVVVEEELDTPRVTRNRTFTLGLPAVGIQVLQWLKLKERTGQRFPVKLHLFDPQGEFWEPLTTDTTDSSAAYKRYWSTLPFWEPGSVRVRKDGVEVSIGFTVNPAKGYIEFDAAQPEETVVEAQFVYAPVCQIVDVQALPKAGRAFGKFSPKVVLLECPQPVIPPPDPDPDDGDA